MKTKFFETKEQYINFRNAWKAAVNNPRSKSTLESHDEYLVDKANSYRRTLSKGTGQHRVSGWLRAEHYVLFNIIKGRDTSIGFSPITKDDKVTSNRSDAYNAYNCAVYVIDSMRTQAQLVIGTKLENDWILKQTEEYQNKHRISRITAISKFLEPLGGTVTIEQLANLEEVSYKKKEK